MTTTISDRGQTSVPASLRKSAGLKHGKRLHWYPLSEKEFRVVVETTETAPGPLAALGWAKRFHPDAVPTSDEAMRIIREGDEV